MRDFDEQNITDAVLDRFAATPDKRLKQILTGLVKHLHDFVRESEITTEEWNAAIGFLTRTGQICSGSRQEFILLSDTLGVSMLVDAINHRFPAGATESTVLGPFYVDNPPEFAHGFDISKGLKGEPLYVDVTVAGPDGRPAKGAIVDVWHSDTDGFYDVQRDDLKEPTLRGRFRADAEGRVRFWSILPSPYPIPNDGPVGKMLEATKRHPWRPAHLHFMVFDDGCETLVTHLFVDGDKYLDSDAVFGVKNSLIKTYGKEKPGTAPDGTKMDRAWRTLTHDFHLAPAIVRKSA